jgi:hypothetical protein
MEITQWGDRVVGGGTGRVGHAIVIEGEIEVEVERDVGWDDERERSEKADSELVGDEEDDSGESGYEGEEEMAPVWAWTRGDKGGEGEIQGWVRRKTREEEVAKIRWEACSNVVE